MKVLLFAGLAEVAGESVAELNLAAPVSVKAIKAELVNKYPSGAMAELLQQSFAAVNHEYCPDDTLVHATDELALIPPVSGG